MPNVLITGANRGIGFEFARQYAADGWHVVATCRNPDRADELQKLARQNPSLKIEKLDVTDCSAIEALAKKLEALAIDVLINNAGIISGGAYTGFNDGDNDPRQIFGNIDSAEWLKVLQTNSVAPVMISQAFLPHIKRGKEKKLAMISSRCGSLSDNDFPEFVAYDTSKAALNMAMRNISSTLRPDGIAVLSLHPGWVQTDMGGDKANIAAQACVSGMRQVIANLTLDQSGSFLRYNGDVVSW